MTSFIEKILGPSVRTFFLNIFDDEVLKTHTHILVYLCTDINPHACRCTRLTGKQNQVITIWKLFRISTHPSLTSRFWQVDIQVINASLADPFYQRLSNKVDVLLFNPPYVPTSEGEVLHAQDMRNIQGSWAGGSDGMQVTYAFLDQVDVCIFIIELDL